MGGPVLGIVFGIGAAFWKRPPLYEKGIQFSSKKILQAAIILLGFGMNLLNVYLVGRQSLLIMIFTIGAAFITARLCGVLFQLQDNTRTLIGVGTAICGGSAIAATAPIIDADDQEIAYSISTIFLFNVAAVFIFPPMGHLLQMNDLGFGMWAGTAINDTSSVVAAGYSFSDAAGNFATIVKLTRTLMIVPITLVMAIHYAKRNKSKHGFSVVKIFPWFIVGFLGASLVSSAGIVSAQVAGSLTTMGKFFITVAMAAIGLNTNLRRMLSYGFKPIFLGLACWIAVALTSLIIQHAVGIW